jgi:hypothetical protein
MLLRPAAAPSPRTVVGLLADGPRLIGFNAKSHRLEKPLRMGLKLDLAHLELLSALVGTGRESDVGLVDAICKEFITEPKELKKIVRGYRELPSVDSVSPDVWQPLLDLEYAERDIRASRGNLLEPNRLLAVRVPLLLRVGKLGFEHVNHRSQVALSLNAIELSALRHLTK